jgi:hypothetical protein
MVEAYFPTLPKIELNRRGPARKGWSAWGNEAQPGEYDEATGELVCTDVDARPDVNPTAYVESEAVASEIQEDANERGEDSPSDHDHTSVNGPHAVADDLEIPAFLRRNQGNSLPEGEARG